MKNTSLQFIGWIGVLLILLAYILVTFSYLSPENIWYPILNVVGSFGIVIEAGAKKDWQPTVLNVIWIVVAMVAIIRIII